MTKQLYFLTLNLNMGNQSGIDLPGLVVKVKKVLCDYAKATRCIHKFKVSEHSAYMYDFNVCSLDLD